MASRAATATAQMASLPVCIVREKALRGWDDQDMFACVIVAQTTNQHAPLPATVTYAKHTTP